VLDVVGPAVLPVVDTLAPAIGPASSDRAAAPPSAGGTTTRSNATPTAATPPTAGQPLAVESPRPLTPAAPVDISATPEFAQMPESGAPHDPRQGLSADQAPAHSFGSDVPAALLQADPFSGSVSPTGSSPRSSVRPTEAPASPSSPPSGPLGIGFSGSFAPPATALFLAVLLALCFAPCLRYGKVVLASARWRPVLFVSLLERPG
jgi:hypothetical protein